MVGWGLDNERQDLSGDAPLLVGLQPKYPTLPSATALSAKQPGQPPVSLRPTPPDNHAGDVSGLFRGADCSFETMLRYMASGICPASPGPGRDGDIGGHVAGNENKIHFNGAQKENHLSGGHSVHAHVLLRGRGAG